MFYGLIGAEDCPGDLSREAPDGSASLVRLDLLQQLGESLPAEPRNARVERRCDHLLGRDLELRQSAGEVSCPLGVETLLPVSASG